MISVAKIMNDFLISRDLIIFGVLRDVVRTMIFHQFYDHGGAFYVRWFFRTASPVVL